MNLLFYHRIERNTEKKVDWIRKEVGLYLGQTALKGIAASPMNFN